MLDTLDADGPVDLVHCATGGAPQVKRATDETDSKAAKVLALPVEDVRQLALDLWRVSLAEERDRRLAEQKRAGVTDGRSRSPPAHCRRAEGG